MWFLEMPQYIFKNVLYSLKKKLRPTKKQKCMADTQETILLIETVPGEAHIELRTEFKSAIVNILKELKEAMSIESKASRRIMSHKLDNNHEHPLQKKKQLEILEKNWLKGFKANFNRKNKKISKFEFISMRFSSLRNTSNKENV